MNTPFETIYGVAAPLPLENVDTDRIIPARFLKTITREGLGQGLFFSLRFDAIGNERADFVLNRAGYRSSKILVTLENFGCGSSREHAPWALSDFGIRCVIAPSFAEIFATNCGKNGLLLITLPRSECEAMIESAERSVLPWTIDLPAQQIARPDAEAIPFAISAALKRSLLTGADEIHATLEHLHRIEAREVERRIDLPWLPDAGDGRLHAQGSPLPPSDDVGTPRDRVGSSR